MKYTHSLMSKFCQKYRLNTDDDIKGFLDEANEMINTLTYGMDKIDKLKYKVGDVFRLDNINYIITYIQVGENFEPLELSLISVSGQKLYRIQQKTNAQEFIEKQFCADDIPF